MLILLIAALAVFGIYKLASPKPAEGTKSVIVEVADDNGEIKTYEAKTDAEYLKDLMDELAKATDFSYEGGDGQFGLYITSINGIEAIYENDGAYWAIYVNGEYGSYGADQQPVNDGDTFRFAYEKY